MAEAIVTTFRPPVSKPNPIEELVLIPSGGGLFEIRIDGELVYSKAATGQHTTNEHAIELVRARLSS